MLFTVALTDAGAGGIEAILGLVVPLALMFGLMYLLLIRPQKKKEKKLREQIESMVVGDNIVTIGGIVGRIVNLKDDEVTMSTSVKGTLITLKKSSVNTVVKPLSD